MSLITLRPTPSCAACAAVTLLPFPSNSELSTSSVNLFQHSRATLGNYLLLHRIHLHSRIFAPLYFLSLSLYPSNSSASIPLRLQCPSRISDLLYLISQQLLHSTYLLSSLLDTATSAARAIPSALESTTPTSSSLRDLGGEPDYQDQGIRFHKAWTNLKQFTNRTNTHRLCCGRSNTSTGVLHQRSQGRRPTQWRP
jgi:hypothetical protein